MGIEDEEEEETAGADPEKRDGPENNGSSENNEADEMDHDHDEDNTAVDLGEHWLEKLMESSYDALSMDERVALLSGLCDLCINSMTVRMTLQRRYDEQQRIKKAKAEDDKLAQNLVRARKLVEAAERARNEEHAAKVEEAKLAAMKEGLPFDGMSIKRLAKSNDDKLLDAKVLEAEREVRKTVVASLGSTAADPVNNLEEFNRDRTERALKELNMNDIRLVPLGTDRRFNRYWRFTLDGEAPPGQVDRIYVETLDGNLKYIPDASSLSNLVKSLSDKGPREKELKWRLSLVSKQLIGAMPVKGLPGGPARDANRISGAEELSMCDLTPCATEVFMSEDLEADGRDQGTHTIADAIRRGLRRICTVLNDDQFSDFDKDAFLTKVSGANSLLQLRELLGDIEIAVQQTCIHCSFMRDPLLVKGAWITVGSEVATAAPGSSFADQLLSPDSKGGLLSTSRIEGGRLAWLPLTSQSISLRLMALDASILYRNDACGRDVMPEYRATQRPFPGSANGLVETMYCINGGHVDAAFFSPYPYRMNFGPRMDFIFPLDNS